MMKRFAPVLIVCLMLVMLASCDKPRLIDESSEVTNHSWNAADKKTFSFSVPDTNTKYNFFVNFRNADDYPYRNIYFFIHTDFPNGKHHTDTLECLLTNDEGRWLGKGQGDLWDNQIAFRNAMRFPLTGQYKMTIEQAMRMPELPGVYNVGLRIEKAAAK